MSSFLLAAAAAPPVPAVSLESGIVGSLLGVTRGAAFSLFVFSLLVALLLEAFGRSPLAPKDYAGCVFRAVCVLVLLTFYAPIFGGVFSLAEGIAKRVTPDAAWGSFSELSRAQMDQLFTSAAQELARGEDSASAYDRARQYLDLAASSVGGFVFDSLMAVLILLGQVAHFVMSTIGRVLSLFFFVLGPLALVASIPSSSGTGGRWFRAFCIYASWPLFSGLILQLTLTVGLTGLRAGGLGGTTGALAMSLVLLGTALLVPRISELVIGGAAPNLVAHSWKAMREQASDTFRAAEPLAKALGRKGGGGDP